MILTLLLTLYPLWYCVINTTILFLMNILRYPPLMVLLCRTLNISGPLAGWPPAICINTANFSRNLTMRPMYRLTASRSIPEHVSGFMNLSRVRVFLSTRSNNYLSPSAGMWVRWSFKKFHPGCSSVGLSRMLSYGTLGTGSAT
jgi:hypothetical protein